ncbi:4-alpha-glucanotransferase [Halorhabdus sp. BNX81]|uniref:4-alpha-glucanotransferase n=1 Tax=Halorhabdus sp. BNX81 TaxID=2980181 RepID=UPI0023DD2A29|nr:4-alpha-glucanotransferase [Halorhabdus sp. BNX81]WEL20612.1 4-alpha-glucanotransferase, glycosyl hydrolase family 77 [Halorhabdus sp. BNX81]
MWAFEPSVMFDRQSGVFLHLTSLPGPHGIGDLGAGARTFLDVLERAEQSLWQFCPVTPTVGVHGHSPYASPSAFAGNPLLVDLTALVDRGWLGANAIEDPPADPHTVHYDDVAAFKRDRLRMAFEGFEADASEDARAAFDAFRERESTWLEEYTVFAALKAAHDGAPWVEWPADLAGRDAGALAAARENHADAIRYHAFVQWIFDEQWRDLRAAADERGISLVGDLPIYVAWDSADVWANPGAFQLDEAGQPTAVAGVPPNPGDDGQRWGNPVYDWETLRADEYGWWRHRLDRLLSLVDIARIDHFKAFDEYWAIPADADDPAAGEWQPGPGADFFETVRAELGELPFIVEDLGFLDERMVSLRDQFEFPGMRVPHYADWCQEGHRYKPTVYPEHCVAYTSTHDTDTAVGFYETLPADQRECLEYALATDGEGIAWDLIEAVWHSEATLALTTVPDLLERDSEARLNRPGTDEGNWTWRVSADELDGDFVDRLASITRTALR